MTAVALTYGRRLAGGATLAVVCSGIGAVIVERSGSIRLVAAVLMIFALVLLAIGAPSQAVIATMAMLPFLALARRMLIDFEPWHSTDPLLLVAPAVVLVLLTRQFLLQGRQLGGDRMSTLVLVLLGLTLLQTVNPRGGSAAAGVGALLFAGMPLLWFFVGREFVDDAVLLKLLAIVAPVALVVASYGLIQTQKGFPHWDAAWLHATGYSALAIGNRIRAFGTLASAAEYAVYLAIGVIASLVLASRVRLVSLAFLPVVAIALFLDSSRGVVVMTILALVVVAGARSGSPPRMLALVVIASLGAYFFLHAYGGKLQARAAATDNPLVTHQVNGLVNPLDPQQSTLLLHWHGVVSGFTVGFRDPLGSGIASTTLAGAKLGGKSRNTEVDISDAFVGLGLPGGLAYVTFVLLALWRTARLALWRRDALSLAALGILIITLGQWLNGAYYAVSALVWILLGWVAAKSRPAAEAD